MNSKEDLGRKKGRRLSADDLFNMEGKPSFLQAFPLSLQHVAAMIVGCVTPAIIVANAAGLSDSDSVILIQAALFVSALTTLLQLYPLFHGSAYAIGSGLPMIMGISFAYVPTMQAIATQYDVATILGAQIVGGIVALLVGLFIKQIRKFFPPLITGTVVFAIGLSLYPTAINYMAGGTSNEHYGAWQNWLVAIIVLCIVTYLNHYGKGIFKLASILIGIIIGYIISIFFGMVDFSSVTGASLISIPQPLHFGIKFDPSACVAIGLLFAINAIQAIGDFSATTTGGLDRMPTDEELKGGIVAYGISNVVGAVFGGLPTATYSQNVYKGCSKKGIPYCGNDSACCRSGACILSSFDNDSLLCIGRCNNFCIRIHHNDRYQADHNSAIGFPQYNNCRSGNCPWYGCDTGECSISNIPSLGNNYFW